MDYCSERLTDFGSFGFDVGVEKRLAYDGKRQSHHLFRDVDCRSVDPAFAHSPSVFGHHRRVGVDSLSMKRGLNQPSLTAMKLALAGKQPFSEESLGHFKTAALGKVSAVRDQNVSYVIGVIYEVNLLAPELEIDKIAVFASLLHQEAQRITRYGQKKTARQLSLRPRRIRGNRHGRIVSRWA